MPSSAICNVNGNPLATQGVTGADVAAGSTVIIELVNTDGVQPGAGGWTISCTSVDGFNPNSTTSSQINASLVINYTHFTATFTAPSLSSSTGSAMVFTSMVNSGTSNFDKQTFGIFVRDLNGLRPFAGQEQFESNATVGCAYDLNALVNSTVSNTLSGDVTGPVTSNTVVALRGKSLDTSLSSLGSAQDGYVLTWVNSSSDWQAKAGSDVDTLFGDVTGPSGSNVVSAISGSTPIIITPASLQFKNSTSSPSISQQPALSGAGTSMSLAAQAAATGSNANGGNITIVSGNKDGSGTAGQLEIATADNSAIVILNPTTGVNLTGVLHLNNPFVTFAATPGGNVTIGQQKAASGAGATILINGQDAATSSAAHGGNILISGGQPDGIGGEGTVTIESSDSSGQVIAQNNSVNLVGVVTVANLGTGVVHSDSSGNLTSSTIVNADVAAAAAIAVSKLAAGTSAQVLLNNATPTPTWTTLSSDVTISATGATTVNSISGSTPILITPASLQFKAATVSPSISQQVAASGAGTSMSLAAQAAAVGSNANGGNITIVSGNKDGSGTAGQLEIATADNSAIAILNPTTGITLTGNITLNNQFVTFAASPGGNVTIGQRQAVSGAGAAILINGQNAATGSAAHGGNILISGGVPDGIGGKGTVTIESSDSSASVVVQSGVTNITGTTQLASYISAPYLKTDGSGFIVAGSAAPILSGGTAGGDLSGTYPNPTVAAISGSTPIAITPNSLQWINTATPTLSQADKTTNSGTGALMKIQAQNETGTTSTGGGLTLTSGTGTTAAGAVLIQTGGTTRLTANASGVVTVANLSTGIVHSDSSGNLTSSTIVNADVAAAAAIAVSKLAAGTSAQVLLNSATPTPTWTTLSSDVTISATGATTVNSISGSTPIAITPAELQYASATASPTIDQATPASSSSAGTAATNMAVNAQTGGATTGSATTAGVGGNIRIGAGAGGDGSGGTNASGGAGGNVSLRSGAGGAKSGSGTVGANGNISLQLGATELISISGSTVGNITVTNTAATPNFTQTAPASSSSAGTAANNTSYVAQFGGATTGSATTAGVGGILNLTAGTGGSGSGGTNANGGAGGNVVIGSGTGGAKSGSGVVGANGTVIIQTGGTTRLTAGATGVITIANLGTGLVHSDASGNLTSSAVVTTDITPGTSGQVLMSNATPATTWTTLSSDVTISATGATTVNSISGSTPISITPVTLQFATATSNPVIKQADLTTNSGTGSSLTIQSQNETGTTSTGGALILTSGTGTTAAGAVNLQVGGTTNLSLTSGSLFWAGAVSNPVLSHTSISTGSGTTFTIQAQPATGGSHNGGNLVLAGGTSGSATAGNVNIQSGGLNQLTISPTVTTLGVGSGNTSTVMQVGGTTNMTLVSGQLQMSAASLLLKNNVFNDATSAAVQTTNATLTTIYTDISIPASTVFDFVVTVVGINTSTQDVYRADFSFTYSRVGSAAPLAVGAAATALNVRTSLAANTWGGASVALSTNAVIIQVTGKSATTIDWNCSFSRIQVA